MPDIPASEITDPKVYMSRRALMRAAVLAGTVAATSWVYRQLNSAPRSIEIQRKIGDLLATSQPANAAFRTDEKQTSFGDITHYNNFYEFSTDKDGVADAASSFVARPWTVTVGGLVRKPKTFDIHDLLKIAPAQER